MLICQEMMHESQRRKSGFMLGLACDLVSLNYGLALMFGLGFRVMQGYQV